MHMEVFAIDHGSPFSAQIMPQAEAMERHDLRVEERYAIRRFVFPTTSVQATRKGSVVLAR